MGGQMWVFSNVHFECLERFYGHTCDKLHIFNPRLQNLKSQTRISIPIIIVSSSIKTMVLWSSWSSPAASSDSKWFKRWSSSWSSPSRAASSVGHWRWCKRWSRWSQASHAGQAASRCQHNLRCSALYPCTAVHIYTIYTALQRIALLNTCIA